MTAVANTTCGTRSRIAARLRPCARWLVIGLALALGGPAFGLDAEVKGRFQFTGDGRLKVLGQTNLPSGLRLNIYLIGDGFRLRTITTVEDGRYEAGPFGYLGEPLPSGQYTLRIDAGVAAGQPEDVRAAIGGNWEEITGPYIVEDEAGVRSLVREVEFSIQ